MSEFVDYKKKQAFHLNIKDALKIITENYSRKFCIKNDFNLYETIFYIKKEN